MSSNENIQQLAFDFVIVGGGTAGLVLANRLSEDGSKQVAVVEAGGSGKGNPSIEVPGMAGGPGTFMSAADWAYFGEAEEHLGGRKIYYPRGKLLGGSSAFNAMMWNRGYKGEVDAWQELGNGEEQQRERERWSWQNVLQYAKKAETHTPLKKDPQGARQAGFNPDFHGTNGPCPTTYSNHYYPQQDRIVPTLINLGVPRFEHGGDSMGGNNVGVGYTPSALFPDTQKRVDSEFAYLTQQVLDRPNLKVLQHSLATKIIWTQAKHGQDVVAEAVEVEMRDAGADESAPKQRVIIKAHKEVILAGGVFNTPQLLELSGVGDAKLLSSLGIDSVVDLPGVGENLKDHPCFQSQFQIKGPYSLDNIIHDQAFMAEQFQLFATQQTGVFNFAMDTTAYLRDGHLENLSSNSTEIIQKVTSDAKREQDGSSGLHSTVRDGISTQRSLMTKAASDWPQMELCAAHIYMDHTKPLEHPDPRPHANITVFTVIQHPYSRGSVHIASKDAAQHPKIVTNILKHPVDQHRAVLALQLARKFAKTEPFKSGVVKDLGIGEDQLPDDAPYDLWLKHAKQQVTTEHHPVGTTPMMSRSLGGVLDENLLVHGTKNVSVVDASMLPLLMSAHPQSIIYGVAELAADLIKSRHA
ncbi:Glucose dehydrogenase/choline dehydrogenase/mandelonitrile lyase (GMC oxidoreductase family) [Ceraceosorus bombacis]|uniref:Glucose dehydrogenase/choline dehydrogenase/mandelonitrile lyase (GMC oxidoreductase family) n=1 Tax=Ceraceosorus bombacis TaxID=401625 RepID=A0A0P1BJT6_9BASI|nr:Glucose dehydrogenase/choline dehydrogenase/mandelonitrile lyase (GMC oxidoreductase family) [Ceraceosorus bombacis]